MRFSEPKPLTAAQQFLLLRKNLLSAGDGTLGSGCLEWRFRAPRRLHCPVYTGHAWNLRLTDRPGFILKLRTWCCWQVERRFLTSTSRGPRAYVFICPEHMNGSPG